MLHRDGTITVGSLLLDSLRWRVVGSCGLSGFAWYQCAWNEDGSFRKEYPGPFSKFAAGFIFGTVCLVLLGSAC